MEACYTCFSDRLCILLCSAIKKLNKVLLEPSIAAEAETKHGWAAAFFLCRLPVTSFVIFRGGEVSEEYISVGSMVTHLFELALQTFLL